jgi:histidinol-phosphate aminotransferase
MRRRDWTEPLPPTSLLDLSSNVCYDQHLKFSLDQSVFEYPDDSLAYHQLSQYYNINSKNIAIGYGSSELILRILSAYKDMTITIVKPSWQLAEFYAQGLEMNIQDRGDLLYIANPNGLNGQSLSREEILEIISRYKLAIVDEAYGDFSNSSVIDYATELDNLIVVKTLSKTIASPGLRVGYCFSNQKIIKQLQDVRPGYVTSTITAGALKILLPQIKPHVSRMLDTRNYIENKYSVVPSQGNYILFKNKPKISVVTKQVDGLYRMALTDIETFKDLENEYR